MDNTTHEVRLANWKTIVEQCQSRPRGQTVAEWCAQNDIREKQYYYWQRRVRRQALNEAGGALPATVSRDNSISFMEISVPHSLPVSAGNSLLADFHPEAVIRRGDIIIGLSNSISDRLLDRILKGAPYAG